MALASSAGLGVDMVLVFGASTGRLGRAGCGLFQAEMSEGVSANSLCDAPCVFSITTHILSISFQRLPTSLDEGSGM